MEGGGGGEGGCADLQPCQPGLLSELGSSQLALPDHHRDEHLTTTCNNLISEVASAKEGKEAGANVEECEDDEANFFLSLELQSRRGRWDSMEALPPSSSNRGQKEEAEDNPLSFIESIGLYWINPASARDHGPWICHGNTVDDTSAADQVAHHLEESLEDEGPGQRRIDADFVVQHVGGQDLANETTAGVAEAESGGHGVDNTSGQIEELDFLSMLGLTKVTAGSELGGSGQARKWRLWQPEEECEDRGRGGGVGSPPLWADEEAVHAWHQDDLLCPEIYWADSVHNDPTVMEDQVHLLVKKAKSDIHPEKRSSFHCSPCKRTLASQESWQRHLASELHFKNSLPQPPINEAHIVRVPRQQAAAKAESQPDEDRVARTAAHAAGAPRQEPVSGTGGAACCPSCGARVQQPQLGKHLVSHFHYHRSLGHPQAMSLVIENIEAIVKQAPFQCQPCQFYCNWHEDLVDHIAGHGYQGDFWCQTCLRILKSGDELMDHMSSPEHCELIAVLNRCVPAVVQRISLLSCLLCNRQFRLNIALKLHMRTEHHQSDFQLPDQQRYCCQFCSFTTYKAKAIAMHDFLVHPSRKRKHRCRICCKAFAKEEQLKQHRNTALHRQALRAHQLGGEEESSKTCSYCGKGLRGVTALKKHLEEEHLRLLPTCVLCGAMFHFPQQLAPHIRQLCQSTCLPPRGPHACDHCKFVAHKMSQLALHVRKKHPQLTESSASWPLANQSTAMSFKCQACYRHCESEEELNAHVARMHPISNQLTCQQPNCGYTTGRRKLLALHVKRSHQPRGPADSVHHTCPTCSRVYCTREGLKAHMRVHLRPPDDDALLRCTTPGCTFAARFQSDVDRHAVKHAVEKQLACDQCAFACKRKSELSRHQRLQHSNLPEHRCAECAYSTRNMDHLKRHVRLRHKAATARSRIVPAAIFGEAVIVAQAPDFVVEMVVV